MKFNSNMFQAAVLIFLVILICRSCDASPKYEDSKSTYPNNQWRRAFKENDTSAEQTNAHDRAERLGFTTGYGSGVNGYPYSGSGVGVYSPLKLDLGGLVIGAIIGVGALLIVPKLVGAFQGGYGGGNYRSAVDSDSTSGLADMLAKLDEVLSQNNIDSTTCVQRAVCSYVRSSEYHLTTGQADQSDQLIHSIAGNALVEYMLNGTAIKEAMDNGKNMKSRECDAIYPGCPLDRTTVNNMLTKMLPKQGN